MKKLLLTTAASLLTVAAFSQGIVTFANASSEGGWTVPSFDRLVHWGSNSIGATVGSLVASNSAGVNLTSLRAALYYAASTDFDPNFVGFSASAASAVSTFKNSTSATAGSWFRSINTLQTIPLGTTANLVVLVWDNSVSTDPLSAAARAPSAVWGASAIFQYTPPTNPQALPSDFLLTGLTAFTIGNNVPEPSTFALAGLGAAALLFIRRRK